LAAVHVDLIGVLFMQTNPVSGPFTLNGGGIVSKETHIGTALKVSVIAFAMPSNFEISSSI
jgi:hypothetical protein